LAQFISNSTGVTSVGCGACVWEYFLSQFIKEIRGIDIIDKRIEQSLDKVSFQLASEDLTLPLPQIPKNHTLLSIFPIPKVPLEEYVRQYEGNCIIILGDHAYSRLPELKLVIQDCHFEICFDDVTVLPWRKAFMVWKRSIQ
jgi:hypothetical protein